MNSKSKLTLSLIAILLFCLTAAVFSACGNSCSGGVTDTSPEKYGIISADGFTIDYTKEVPLVYGDVSSSTEQIDLSDKISVTPGCTWKLYLDFEASTEIILKSIDLDVGHNRAYIIVYQTSEDFIRCELDIYRLDIKEYTFKNLGSTYDSGTVEEKSSINAPEAPEREGYTFSGWAVVGSSNIVQFPYTITENTTFVAQYKIINYTITYHLNGGANAEGNPESYNIETDAIILQAATHEDYTFIGWYSDELFANRVYEIEFSGDIDLYAKWAFSGTEGLAYSLSGNEYTVTGYAGTDSEVIIPKKYNNLPVTAIGSDAFNNCQNLESIIIPCGVTKIDWYAFKDCTRLKSVAFEANSKLTSIGYSAFNSCTSLESITIPNGVTSIGYTAFYDCESLESITIPDSVTSIGNLAFSGCTSLVSVIFKNTDGWWVVASSTETSGTGILSNVLANPLTAAIILTSTYSTYYWNRD